MVKKMRSAIGGLALMTAAAFGQGVTNSPVLLKPQIVEYSPKDKITIAATNFNNGVAFNLYKSTNLIDWVKTPLAYSGFNPTSVVSNAYLEGDPAYRSGACFLLSTTNTPSFKK